MLQHGGTCAPPIKMRLKTFANPLPALHGVSVQVMFIQMA